MFSRFEDATSVRGAAMLALGSGLSLAATYGEGIAQPTFFDLYGFFPGSFAGNPALRPERSRGGEASLRFRRGGVAAALTYFRQRLQGEIVDVFAFPLSTTVNATGTSRRAGVEAEFDLRFSPAFSLSAHYAYLDAAEPSASGPLREQRRPRHSGSAALDGARGRLSYGAAIAFTGAHVDTDFERFPAERVRLGSYWLASARIAYLLRTSTEVHLRMANAFDANYQDVHGYRTDGRSIHAGIRLALAR